MATAPIRPLAWQTPRAAGAAVEKTERLYICVYIYIYSEDNDSNAKATFEEPEYCVEFESYFMEEDLEI